MSGHSFCAVTTQAVSGPKPLLGKGFTDDRMIATVVMSPNGPANGNTKHAFGSVKTVSTAFWDAHLRNDEEARLWLNSDAVKSVLEKDDQWQMK